MMAARAKGKAKALKGRKVEEKPSRSATIVARQATTRISVGAVPSP